MYSVEQSINPVYWEHLLLALLLLLEFSFTLKSVSVSGHVKFEKSSLASDTLLSLLENASAILTYQDEGD